MLTKLHSEYECVDEFIFIESAYDTHGNYKGLVLNEILKDKRFRPFLDKITVLSNEESFYPKDTTYNEKNNLLCEFNSRAHCWSYIQKKYDNDSWIFAEDADEMFDFNNPKRRDLLLDSFKKENGSIQYFCTRYWWDFDNFTNYEKYTPCHQVGKLKEMENPFHHRNRDCKIINLPLICSYEYSHCFDVKNNWIKVTTSAHDKYQQSTMENAYKYNTFHREPQRGESLRYPIDFFETIDLNEENSPKFVLDNLDSLRVNTIDPNYAENRVMEFNCHPHPCLQYNLMRGNKIRKDRNYYNRNKL